MEDRSANALAAAARAVAELPWDRRVIVAVDGVDGAGKTTFADLLAPRLARAVVRASADDFLNPRAIRHGLGRHSPEGFFRDSVDLTTLAELLLDPFAAGAAFRRQAFDHRADARVAGAAEQAPPGALLLLDGLFLHRDELRDRWDLSILLDVPPAVSAERILRRDGLTPTRRYVAGQELYFATCAPRSRAGLVLDW